MSNSNNMLVIMSGGTTTVINATLAGIVDQAKQTNGIEKVIAGIPGINGVLDGAFLDLTSIEKQDILRLSKTPGSSITGTTRVAMLTPKDLEALRKRFIENNIGMFINIGGNGTIKQTKLISQNIDNYIRIAAAPKTVDNDLGDSECKDVFFTPGFPSCVNHWVKAIQLLNIENIGSYSHDKVLVAQTFGRETGFIAGSVRIVDPNRKLPLLILLPEDPQSIDNILNAIDSMIVKHRRAIVVVSEGYPIGDIGEKKDLTGQTMFGSSDTTSAQLLVTLLNKHGIQARSYIPTVLQRQDFESTLNFDRSIAYMQGADIVKRMDSGESSFLSSISAPNLSQNESVSNNITAIKFDSFDDYSRSLNDKFIMKGSFDVSDLYINYLNSLFKVSDFEKCFTSYNNQFISQKKVQEFYNG